MKRLSLLLVSCIAASAALATTYVRVEKDGTKTYSDRPLPGGQPVEVEPAQTYSTPSSSTPTPSAPSANLPREQQLLRNIDDFRYSSCALSPQNDSTFTNPLNVPVSVSTQPSLRVGDVVQITLDGKPAAPGALSMVLEPAYRGTHTAQVVIKDGYGRVLCSASTSFHVMRPSVNMPGRR